MRSLVLFLIAAAASACSPYSPDLGAAPFLCGSGGSDEQCPEGYQCMSAGTGASVCVEPNGKVPDGGMGNCADDSNLEPNNTIQTAYVTSVATQRPSLVLAGLAICPAGDKDTYSVTITTEGQNLEVIAVFDPGGATLSAAILSSTGNPIANASPVTGMNGTIRAYTANLPTGVLYAQVTGPASGTLLTNNYKLTINVTGP